MKKLVLLIFTVCMGGGIAASAQEVSQQKLDSLNQALSDISARVKETEAAESNRAIWKDRSKYFNLNYVNQKLSPDIDGWDKLGGGELKSDFGAAIVWGKTYYLHKKPLAGMIKFGIDWSWMDLNYAQYKLETYDYDTDDYGYDQWIDAGSFADYFILNEFTTNYDAGWLSTYLYKDIGGKYKMVIWDFNSSTSRCRTACGTICFSRTRISSSASSTATASCARRF